MSENDQSGGHLEFFGGDIWGFAKRPVRKWVEKVKIMFSRRHHADLRGSKGFEN